MRLRWICLVLCWLCPAVAAANFELDSWPVFWFPQGRLEKFSDGSMGTGASFRLGWNRTGGRKTIRLFSEFSLLDFGRRERRVPYFNAVPIENGQSAASPVLLHVHSEYSLLLFGPGIGIEYDGILTKPYLEAFAGLAHGSTSSDFEIWEVREGMRYDRSMIDRAGYVSDTWYGGLAAGVKILLWQRVEERGFQGIEELRLDCKGGYLRGGPIGCLDTGTVSLVAEREFQYEAMQPPLSHLQFRFGMSMLL